MYWQRLVLSVYLAYWYSHAFRLHIPSGKRKVGKALVESDDGRFATRRRHFKYQVVGKEQWQLRCQWGVYFLPIFYVVFLLSMGAAAWIVSWCK